MKIIRKKIIKRIIKISVIIVISLFLWQFIKCFILRLSDYPGVNNGVYESKQRRVFLKKYCIIPNRIIVDKDTIIIKEVWAERPWQITDRCNDKIQIFNDFDYYYLNFKLGPTALAKLNGHYNHSWMFKCYKNQQLSVLYDMGSEIARYSVEKNIQLNDVNLVIMDDLFSEKRR